MQSLGPRELEVVRGYRVQSYGEQYRAQGDTPGTIRVDAVSDAGTSRCSWGASQAAGPRTALWEALSGCFSASPVTSYLVNSSLC